MSTRRLGVAVAVLGGFLYAVGGSDGTSPLNTGMVVDHGVAFSCTEKQKKSLTFVHMLLWHLTPTNWQLNVYSCLAMLIVGVPSSIICLTTQQRLNVWMLLRSQSSCAYMGFDRNMEDLPPHDMQRIHCRYLCHCQIPQDTVRDPLTQKWHTAKPVDSPLRVTLALLWITLNWRSLIQVFPLCLCSLFIRTNWVKLEKCKGSGGKRDGFVNPFLPVAKRYNLDIRS